MAASFKEKDIQMSVNSLLSPPEQKRADSFSSPASASMSRTPSASYYRALPRAYLYQLPANAPSNAVLLSPPISPETIHHDKASQDDEGTRDPPLFSSQESTDSAPLFPAPFQSHYTQQVINEHRAAAATHISEDEYALVGEVLSNIKFHSSAFELFQRDPAGWYKKSLATLKFYDDLNAEVKSRAQHSRKVRRAAPRMLAAAPEGGIRKKVVVPQVKRVKQKRVAPPQPVGSSLPIIAQKAAAPKPPKPATARENDTDFQSVPDYSPPTDTLNGQPRGLRSDWKGTPLHIANEPYIELLHEQEANLASTLRLTPAQYLTSKRRIFEARVNCFYMPKEFRKTDAQQACNIDVNKASKLHSAFEKVGWFQEKWFLKHLRA